VVAIFSFKKSLLFSFAPLVWAIHRYSFISFDLFSAIFLFFVLDISFIPIQLLSLSSSILFQSFFFVLLFLIFFH
jgi:hypothetical protein